MYTIGKLPEFTGVQSVIANLHIKYYGNPNENAACWGKQLEYHIRMFIWWCQIPGANSWNLIHGRLKDLGEGQEGNAVKDSDR
jgi:hypothetical protein